MLSSNIHRDSPYLLVYHRDPVLPVHKLIKPVIPYRGNFDIGHEIQQDQIALITAAKNLQRKREAQQKPYEHRPSKHKFNVGDLVLLNKHKLEHKWEPGYRIVALPTEWTARGTNKETGEPNVLGTLNLKTLQRIGTLRHILLEGEQNSLMTPRPYLTLTL